MHMVFQGLRFRAKDLNLSTLGDEVAVGLELPGRKSYSDTGISI